MAFFWLFTKLPHAVCFNKIVKRLQYKKIASIKNYKTETRKPLITPLGNHKNTMTTAVEKTKPSQSPPPPPTSFSSLPHDVVLNCLARVSRSYSPILSLVSKSFRTLMTSPELHATRTLIGKTEDCLYVCLDLDNNNPNPRWFTLSQIPEQQKLIPISLTHYKVHIGFFSWFSDLHDRRLPQEKGKEKQKRVDPRLWNVNSSVS